MDDFNYKDKKVVIAVIAFFILSGSIFGYLFYQTELGRKENLIYCFDGVVKKVSYDVKGIPDVTIDKSHYYLCDGYDFDYKIEKGDTLKKKKGSSIYKLIKKNTRKIIEFNN